MGGPAALVSASRGSWSGSTSASSRRAVPRRASGRRISRRRFPGWPGRVPLPSRSRDSCPRHRRQPELSSEELAKAAEVLKTLDKNKDGKLTQDEVAPPFPMGGFGGGPMGGRNGRS